MNYIEVKIKKPSSQDQADLMMAEMGNHGFESFVEEDAFMLAYIQQKDYSAEILLEVDALRDVDPQDIQTNVIEDQNWNAVWESNYPPVFIADRCFIRAPFHDADPNAEFDLVLKPKMAFGTAHHETTAMMIELLLEEEVADKRILDMGCGTGVLAILAAIRGATNITAIDYDEWAYNNSVENAEVNGIDCIKVELGNAELLKDKNGFDLILANINKNILLNDMEAYGKVLKSSGKIIFSGFYTDDLEDIQNSAKQNGMNFVSNIGRNNWVAAVFDKQ